MKILQKIMALFLSSWLLFAPGVIYAAQSDQSAGQSATQVVKQTLEELQQMVAPIALYPDALVSQILAAATYPTEIVEADRWVQDHPNLKGKDLANAVDQQPWDPSIKAITQFPSVLANLDKNLAWTSALGEAYVNQSEGVMDAVQVMRARAQASGNLKSNEQEKVVTEEKTIVIEPADPEVVYVPAYDPWIVYGEPVVVWPGWYPYPGLYVDGPGISFGVGFGIGFFAGFGWGWQPGGWNSWHGGLHYVGAAGFHAPAAPTGAVGTVVVGKGGPIVSTSPVTRTIVSERSAGLGIPRGSYGSLRHLNTQVARTGSATLSPAPAFTATSARAGYYGSSTRGGESGHASAGPSGHSSGGAGHSTHH